MRVSRSRAAAASGGSATSVAWLSVRMLVKL